MSRPTSQHRLSVGSNAVNQPSRHSASRSHSHTVSLGSINPGNRISRRKSSTFSPAGRPAAIEAAVEHAVASGSLSINKRSSASRAALTALNDDAPPPLPNSLPHGVSVPNASALVDGPPLSSFAAADKAKPKARRASDGTRLTKKERAATGDLKCEQCGKAYKHGSCLNKHLWEHTPQWQYTSKLLISKHQQVQLLEAASVLVAMNQDGPPTDSDHSSASPPASGSSDLLRDDEASSASETSPPPPSDDADGRDHGHSSKRYSTASSAYSRSYQSAVFSESAPSEHGFGHHRQWSSSSSHRPTTGYTSIADSYRDEDPADLAAAVGLLSCSYGTPKSGPTNLPFDIPPVPPLPEKYQVAKAFGTFSHPHHHDQHAQRDVEMDESEDDRDDDSHARNDDVEGGMWKMDA